MRLLLATAALLAAAAAALPAAAQTAREDRFAVGVQGGTTGVGVEGEFAASDQLVLRASADFFSYDVDASSDDVDYEGDLDLNQGGLFVDFHPRGSSFFVSGGLYFGDRSAEVRATAQGPVEIGNTVFTAAQVGELQGEADIGDVAPFVGVGFNNTFTTAGQVGFKVLVGAAFGEDPDVSLSRVGGVALPANIQTQLDAELRNEEAELEDDLEGYNILPVVQVGVFYRF